VKKQALFDNIELLQSYKSENQSVHTVHKYQWLT